ncbi:Hypothetical_protein [Hexamita inflata]|uniref:Hypothetical_protein n=1 Tax=Hexamita inflata TaxID=28002 RepID=A0AA86RGK0_9EUKA|nr:Hypothetical protein HINF_LOCUS60593 [Hexamita inflata]
MNSTSVITGSKQYSSQEYEYLNDQLQYSVYEENNEEELSNMSSMSSFHIDCLSDTEQHNLESDLVVKSVQVNFRVLDCEETLKQIETIINVPREQFMHGQPSTSPSEPGFDLSFFVILEYYELVWPFQELLSIQQQIQKEILPEIFTAQPEQRSSVQPQPIQKYNQSTTTKIITFLIDDVERFLYKIEQTIGVLRSVFMHGKPNAMMHATGKYIVSFTTPLQYNDRLYKQFGDCIHIGKQKKNNTMQSGAVIGGNKNSSKILKTSSSTSRIISFLTDNVEQFLQQIETKLGVSRSVFMRGKPNIQHGTGKKILSFTSQYFEEISKLFHDYLYCGNKQKNANK